MNPAVTALMREAEAARRKDLPGFRADALIGSSIAVFHRNPDHQRHLLAALRAPHAATIRIGPCVPDLLVTPPCEGEARIGFVVGSASRLRPGPAPAAASAPIGRR
jgi:hypothetical protein